MAIKNKIRNIAANYIFPVKSKPIKNGIITINENGEIIEIKDNNGSLPEMANLEFYNGVITPGFVNTHCHLELSYLKNKVTSNNGLLSFVKQIVEKRNENTLAEKSITEADEAMYYAGIVAVGDTCNGTATIPVKKKSKIYYHSFIEFFGSDTEKSAQIFEHHKNILNQFKLSELIANLTPHAPYSVSPQLFDKFKSYLTQNNCIVSIHNQESKHELEFFKEKRGDFKNFILSKNQNNQYIQELPASSPEYYMQYLSESKKILNIHNTFSTISDIHFIESIHSQAYYVLCPKSNLFIENTMPDFKIFEKYSDKICIGTDSLASNSSLSIFDEIQIILKQNPELQFNNILKWATINGAAALEIDKIFGSLEPHKKPGLVLIDNFNFDKMQPTSKSRINRLV